MLLHFEKKKYFFREVFEVNLFWKQKSFADTTISSDTSDVEGRIELLTQKLADRRLEMTRLKKEARKQAKQRLKALEANLLNQIKVGTIDFYILF